MHANRSTLVKLCLLTALAVPVQRAASATPDSQEASTFAAKSTLLIAQARVAQAEPDVPEFELPSSLEAGDALLIDGSSSMIPMNNALIDQFASRYEIDTVDSAASGTDIALDRLRNNEIDLAAIGRPLSAEEQAAGLVAVPIAREKIAIFTGPDNSFEGDITFEQFGQIFRGEVTDWSEVGNGSASGPLRFIDRPVSSDTRQAFQAYPVFQAAPFETGATAELVAEDFTPEVIEAVGNDGIGYAVANQVAGNSAVKIVPMHQTLPDDPRYPFSQPRSYVYNGEPSAAAQGFLALATSPEGEEAIAQVQETEGAAAAQLDGPAPTAESPSNGLTARTDENNVAIIEDASGNLVAGPLAGAGGAVTALAFSEDGETLATGTNIGKVRYWGIDGEPKGEAFPAVLGEDNAVTELRFEGNDKLFVAGSQGRQGLWGLNGRSFGETAPAATTGLETDADGGFPWWWLLLPVLGLVGAGLWLLSRGRDQQTPDEPRRQTAPTATVPPPVTDPDNEREVSNRAHSVISTDRVVDESRAVITPEPTVAAGVAGATGGIEGTRPGATDLGATGLDTASLDAAGVDTTGLDTIDSGATENLESTDLESPDLEGTNLDLLTPGAVGGAAVLGLGGVAIAAGGQSSTLEDDDEEDEWDDNLDLTLDDPDQAPDAAVPTAQASQEQLSIQTEEQAVTPPVSPAPQVPPQAPTSPLVELPTAGGATGSADDEDFWNTVPGGTELGVGGDEVEGDAVESNAIADDPITDDLTAGGVMAGGVVASGATADDTSADSVSAEDLMVGELSDSEIESAGLSLEEPVPEERVRLEDPAIEASDLKAPEVGAPDAKASDLEAPDAGEASEAIEAIEPTRDTVIAETDTVLDIEPDQNTIISDGTVIFGGATAAGLAVAAASAASTSESASAGSIDSDIDSFFGSTETTNTEMPSPEDTSFEDTGLDDTSFEDINSEDTILEDTVLAATLDKPRLSIEELASVDEGLDELPDGYGDSRIVLLPRDPKWAYAYWDVSNEHKEELRQQGGSRLLLRLYDVTDIDQNHQAPHSMHQQECHEMARSWYIEMPVSDRDYSIEIGYLTDDDRWLMLSRSAPVRVPPIYPSDWIKDQFVTIGWETGLANQRFGNLGAPGTLTADETAETAGESSVFDALFAFNQAQSALRLAGSLYGSMQTMPQTMPPGGLSASGQVSGLNMSGLNVSGLNMSGVGLGDRKRNFWLVADAELIVYGATEPDATLTIGDRVIPLSPDGTFRFHMPFPDSKIDYPIRAVAADGQQSRAITMNFERDTPERNTNTKADAEDEWF